MCSEFVTQQKNVLLTTQLNLNDKKTRQVTKISYQNLWKNNQDSLLSNAGGVSAVGAETTPTHGKASVSQLSNTATTWMDATTDTTSSSLIGFIQPYMFERASSLFNCRRAASAAVS